MTGVSATTATQHLSQLNGGFYHCYYIDPNQNVNVYYQQNLIGQN